MSSCRTRDFPEGWPDTSGDGGSEFIEGLGGNGIATETIQNYAPLAQKSERSVDKYWQTFEETIVF